MTKISSDVVIYFYEEADGETYKSNLGKDCKPSDLSAYFILDLFKPLIIIVPPHVLNTDALCYQSVVLFSSPRSKGGPY